MDEIGARHDEDRLRSTSLLNPPSAAWGLGIRKLAHFAVAETFLFVVEPFPLRRKTLYGALGFAFGEI
jgi:hypothetical protein